ncbi:MAG: SipW-dependent-type signal peptide-containing protein [Christensenellales bacterium]
MEKNKKSKILYGIIVALAVIVCASLSMVTYAWFTDSKSYTGSLTFGEIKLNVTQGVSGSNVTFTVTRTITTYVDKVMPGDQIKIDLKVGITATSEDAYYMAILTDDKNIFKSAAYFSDGSDVYYYTSGDGKTYKQSDGSVASGKTVGAIAKGGAAQAVPILATIPGEATTNTVQKQVANITLKVVAIQQANISAADARTKLLAMA